MAGVKFPYSRGSHDRLIAVNELMQGVPIHVLDTLTSAFLPTTVHVRTHRSKILALITFARDNYDALFNSTAGPHDANVALMKTWFGHLTSLGTPRVVVKNGTTKFARPPPRTIARHFSDDIVQQIVEQVFQTGPARAENGGLLETYGALKQVCPQWRNVLRQCRITITSSLRIGSCLPLKFRTGKRSPVELSRLESWLSSRFVLRPSSVIVDTPSSDCAHTYAHVAASLLLNTPSAQWCNRRFPLEDRTVRLAEVVASLNGSLDPGSAPLAAVLSAAAVSGGSRGEAGTSCPVDAPDPKRRRIDSPAYCCPVCALCQLPGAMKSGSRADAVARDRLLMVAGKQGRAAGDYSDIKAKFDAASTNIDQSPAGLRRAKKNRARQVMLGASRCCRNGGPAALISKEWFERNPDLPEIYGVPNCATLLDVWSTLTLEAVGIDDTKKVHLLAHVLGINRQALTRLDTLRSVAQKMHGPRLRGKGRLAYVFCVAKNANEPQVTDFPAAAPPWLSTSARAITVVGEHAKLSLMTALDAHCGPFQIAGDVYQDSLVCTKSTAEVMGIPTTEVSILETDSRKTLHLFVVLAHLFRSSWMGSDSARKLEVLRIPGNTPQNAVLRSVIAASGPSLKTFSGPAKAFSRGRFPALTELEVTGAWRFENDAVQMPEAPALRSLRWTNSVPLYVSGLLLTAKSAPLLTSLTVVGSGNQKMPDANLSPASLRAIGEACPMLTRVVLAQALYQFTKKHAEALASYPSLEYLHVELRKRVRGTCDSESLNPSALRVLLTRRDALPPLTLSITPSGVDPMAVMDTAFLGPVEAPYRTTMVMVNRNALFRGRLETERLDSVDADSLMPGDEAADMRYRQLLAAIPSPARRNRFRTNWLQSH